jgi:ribonuclease P protein component
VTYVGHAEDPTRTRFGFIVSKQVGSAVARNTVRRRLKAVCAEAMSFVSPGRDVVIRALPGAADADYRMLRDDVVRCLRKRAT